MVKNLPKMQETGVGSLGWEDPLQKETASHSTIQPTLSIENPMAGYSPQGRKEARIF